MLAEVTGSCWKVQPVPYPSEDGQCFVYFLKVGSLRTAAVGISASVPHKKSLFFDGKSTMFIHFPDWKSPESYKKNPPEFHHLCRSWILALHSPSCRSMAVDEERKTYSNFMGIPMRFYQKWGFFVGYESMTCWDVYDMSPTKRLMHKGFYHDFNRI